MTVPQDFLGTVSSALTKILNNQQTCVHIMKSTFYRVRTFIYFLINRHRIRINRKKDISGGAIFAHAF